MNVIDYVFDDKARESILMNIPFNLSDIYTPCQFEIFHIRSGYVKFFDDKGILHEEQQEVFFDQLLDEFYESCFEKKYKTVSRIDRFVKCRGGKITLKFSEYNGHRNTHTLGISCNFWGKNDHGHQYYESHYRAVIHPPFTLQDFKNFNLTVNRRIPYKNDINRFITKIYNPSFVRKPENKNDKTFDFVHIQMNINTSCLNVDRIIRENSYEIFTAVISKIENHRSFKKYGIPVNFLKISSAKYFKDIHLLEMILELKEV